MLIGNAANRVGHRRRGTCRDLAFGRGLGQDPFDVFGKAHAALSSASSRTRACNPSRVSMTRGGYDPSRGLACQRRFARRGRERETAPCNPKPAVDRHDAHATFVIGAESAGVFFARFGDLDRQFARWTEDQTCVVRSATLSRSINGIANAAVFPVPVLRLTENVAAFEQSGIVRAGSVWR